MDRHRGSLFGQGRAGDTADLREHNLALVLRYLRDNGPSSRAQISDSSTLGLSTLTGMIGELKDLDLVTEGLAENQTRLGRPTHSVSLSGHAWVVAGIRVDVDGLQARTATVGGDHLGSYADRADLRGGDPAPAIRMLGAAIDWILETIDHPRALTAVTITVPGFVTPCGDAVARSEALGWQDVDILSAVRKHLETAGCRGVIVDLVSDSSAAAVGIVRGDLVVSAKGRTILYFGGERTVTGAVIIGGEPLCATGLGVADVGRLPVPLADGGFGVLGDVLALAKILEAAGVRTEQDASDLVDRSPKDALAELLAALAEGSEPAGHALAAAMASLSSAIESAVAMIGAEIVVLDGYLGVLGGLKRPPADPHVDVMALHWRPSRIVDGAVFMARDARLARPSSIRGPQS